jgi:metal-dependent amidase/aminoacylase/carboxypeptidase family protein
VLTIARIVAGTTNNVIPESALMEGTLRTLSEPVRSLLHEEIRRVCRHIALAHGCSAAVEIEPGYPVTVNDETAVGRMIGVAASAGPQACGDDAEPDHGRRGLLLRAAEGCRARWRSSAPARRRPTRRRRRRTTATA